MQAFRSHAGVAVPLMQANIDTDQIIPKQFLKRTERTGYGDFLFYDWRYNEEGTANPGFVLNDPAYSAASILIAGPNFGCGSSREHAAWALADYGFRVVIAPSFADIFKGNAAQNGILPLVLPENEIAYLAERTARRDGYKLSVDLEACSWSDDRRTSTFAIDGTVRRRLLEGLDEIGVTLLHHVQIARFEAARFARSRSQ